jgi:tetratricopeptide (TPR) repeat protein
MSARSLGLRRVVAAFACAWISGTGLAAHAAGSDDVAYARATALARAGRCPEALAALAEISQPTAASVNLRAQCQLDAKDWPAALASLEEAKRLDPATPDVELHLAVARFHMGDYAGAREALDAAAPTSENDPQYHLYRGLVLLQAAESEQAANELRRARALSPSAVEPSASYYEGLAWASADDADRAREALDRVIASAPGTPWAVEAERAKQQLAGLAAGRGKAWLLARAGLEYDSNVRLRGNQVFPGDEGGKDGDGRGVWMLHGGTELLSGPGWAAGVQATYYGTAQFDLSDFDEEYPVLGVWYDQRLAEDTYLHLSYDAGYAWYGYDPFVFSQQIRASLFHDFHEYGRTEFFVAPYVDNYLYSVKDVQDGTGVPGSQCPDPNEICGPPGIDESHTRDRDGVGTSAGFEHRYLMDAIDTELLGGAAFLYYDARGTDYSYDGIGTWFGTSTDLPFETAFRTSFGYAYYGYWHRSSYPDPENPALKADPDTEEYTLSNAHRHDHQYYAGAEVEKYITDAWSVMLRYSFTYVESNADVFAYDRHIVGGYVTYRWNR